MRSQKKIFSDLDLNGNYIINFRCEALESDPEPIPGRIYYNSATDKFRACTSLGWGDLGSGGWSSEDDRIVTDKDVCIRGTLGVKGIGSETEYEALSQRIKALEDKLATLSE